MVIYWFVSDWASSMLDDEEFVSSFDATLIMLVWLWATFCNMLQKENEFCVRFKATDS